MLPIRRYENRDRFADHLFGLVTEQPFGARVECCNDPVEVFADDGIIRGFDYSCENAVYLFEIALLSIEVRENRYLRAENARIYGLPDVIYCAGFVALSDVLI